MQSGIDRSLLEFVVLLDISSINVQVRFLCRLELNFAAAWLLLIIIRPSSLKAEKKSLLLLKSSELLVCLLSKCSSHAMHTHTYSFTYILVTLPHPTHSIHSLSWNSSLSFVLLFTTLDRGHSEVRRVRLER